MSQTNVIPFDQPANDLHQDGEALDHFITRDGKVYAGTHLIIDLVGAKHLTDKARMEKAFTDCVEECGATLLHMHIHTFLPSGGLSGVAVLAESHISVHTWPERDYAAFDVFMCGDAQPEKAIAILKRAFEADQVNVQTYYRGEGVE
ncbi:MAG: adenosylmethionine decarboxylase [Pseudomonadota bacterium]